MQAVNLVNNMQAKSFKFLFHELGPSCQYFFTLLALNAFRWSLQFDLVDLLLTKDVKEPSRDMSGRVGAGEERSRLEMESSAPVFFRVL